ncbi:MAG: carboxylating nicotinate-nucleotide diphosphorylase [Bacteroidales bacterium]|nr:carboxylating nicotinate-nucleotide diphosphorylase [Bacteroidales bacterium]MBN2817474.1 carboxylating nicotinate-nucleotide diphosphorylase [Bacteroidales bacterium]
MTFENYIEDFIDLAFKEDIGDGDHTSLSTIPDSAKGKAQLLVKQEGILAGSNVAELIFKKLDPSISLKYFIPDGHKIVVGDIAFEAEGKVLALLQAERLVLNIMQRMSGIATQTNIYVKKLKGLNTKVLDTRKTTPGMRLLDKMAVKLGGGENHRIGLFDMILIKDNHIDFAGGIENAIKRAKNYLTEKNKELKIEIEARSIDDVQTILKIGGIHRIMLDNFTIKETSEAVSLINGKYETESSGGITLENLRDYAECGVDYISVGALTHQIKSLDLSLKAVDF